LERGFSGFFADEELPVRDSLRAFAWLVAEASGVPTHRYGGSRPARSGLVRFVSWPADETVELK
jgi:hypothetical protein